MNKLKCIKSKNWKLFKKKYDVALRTHISCSSIIFEKGEFAAFFKLK